MEDNRCRESEAGRENGQAESSAGGGRSRSNKTSGHGEEEEAVKRPYLLAPIIGGLTIDIGLTVIVWTVFNPSG